MIDELLNSYALTLEYLHRMVGDLEEPQMVCQPKGVVNHPAWTIGHLVFSNQAIGGEIGIAPWLPSEWERQFGTGSTPVADPKVYPRKARLFEALNDGQRKLTERLTALGETAMSEPLPDVRYRDRIPTVGHAVLHILTGHTAMHVGQITVWRRAMGLRVIPEPLNDSA